MLEIGDLSVNIRMLFILITAWCYLKQLKVFIVKECFYVFFSWIILFTSYLFFIAQSMRFGSPAELTNNCALSLYFLITGYLPNLPVLPKHLVWLLLLWLSLVHLTCCHVSSSVAQEQVAAGPDRITALITMCLMVMVLYASTNHVLQPQLRWQKGQGDRRVPFLDSSRELSPIQSVGDTVDELDNYTKRGEY